MHILRNSKPIGPLLPGEWLCQDDNAFQLAMMAERGTVELRAWEQGGTRWPKGDDGPRSILLIRSGAIGDLLLLTPATKALRAKYPNALIWLSCHKRHWDIFAQGDTHFIDYPLPTSELAQFDLIIPLENIVELSTEQRIHATDAFAQVLGVTVEDYRPVYKVTEQETQDAGYNFPRADGQHIKRKPRVALHLHASAAIRGYPMQQWNVVLQTLLNRGWEIMLLGNRDGIKGAPPAIKDCSHLSFREAAAVLATCDVFCGVDSSFFNLCPALGVPAVGLFGPVAWETRAKPGSGQVALHGEAPCAPCGWTNARAGMRFPPNGPCAKTGQCVPLADITPERVVAVIEREAKKRESVSIPTWPRR